MSRFFSILYRKSDPSPPPTLPNLGKPIFLVTGAGTTRHRIADDDDRYVEVEHHREHARGYRVRFVRCRLGVTYAWTAWSPWTVSAKSSIAVRLDIPPGAWPKAAADVGDTLARGGVIALGTAVWVLAIVMALSLDWTATP